MSLNGKKIGVLIEEHYDETEKIYFDHFFGEQGATVVYITRLWGSQKLTFYGNDHKIPIDVGVDIKDVDLEEYDAVLILGGYCSDRLRYAEKPKDYQNSPVVNFIRKAMDMGKKVGTMCHGLWLLTPTDLLKDRKVTCANNIIADVVNAGAIHVDEDTKVDGNLITGRHPAVVHKFCEVLQEELGKVRK